MKKLIVLVILVLVFFSGVAFSEWEYSDSEYMQHVGTPDEHHHHKYFIPDREHELGIGIDAIVYESENELFKSTIESKYDFNDSIFSAYLVGEVNLWKMFKRNE